MNRRGWDSNPGDGSAPSSGFQDRLDSAKLQDFPRSFASQFASMQLNGPACSPGAEARSIPSLPWKSGRVTRAHARSTATQFFLQMSLVQPPAAGRAARPTNQGWSSSSP
jgi:hypothetical protein